MSRRAPAEGPPISRRAFLHGSFATTGLAATTGLTSLGAAGCGPEPRPPPSDGWEAGDVLHLLPTASHDRIRLKASFRSQHPAPPRLVVGEKSSPGRASDGSGRFFSFDVGGLPPATAHRLQLRDGSGRALCADWPLRTLPHPDASPESLRLLVFTCAGGPDNLYSLGFFEAFLPIALRQRLLARALSFAPDAVVANGDHVYWDLKSRFGWAMGRSPRAWWIAGLFDREQAVLGHANEQVLKRAFGPQIAGLYGTLLRSVPTFFLQDDHDYGENDEASEALRTFPPDPFMLDLARATQHLYYPELIASPGVPPARVGPGGLAESYGSFHWGRLFEALLYDCRRNLTNTLDPDLDHANSGFVPPDVERWLLDRTARSPALHLAHMPSTPLLWTAGKWGEWYPDSKDEQGVLRVDAGKPYWPDGWSAQHDRLVGAASARRDRTPLFASGDLHALAAGTLHASNGRSLEANPVVSLLVGPISTGDLGWPSRFRGQVPQASGTVVADEWLAPLEQNGFSLLDFTPDELIVSLFAWHPDQGAEAIDRLEPFRVIRIPRPPRA
ncbi:MAG: alkaline phosphatase D family protein [Myxococcota bacterium]